MKVQYKFFFAILVGLLFNCCKEPQECPHGCIKGPKDTLYCSKEFLPYWYFNKGSTWVYKRTDTSGGIFDTAKVIVTKTSIDFTPSSNSVSAIERRMIQITHSDSTFWSDYIPSKATVVESVSYDPSGIAWTWSSKKLLFFVQYFYSQGMVGQGPFKVGNLTTIKTPVYTIPNSIPFFNEKSGDSVYVSKDIGISKFIAAKETWELVSFKIEP